MALVLSALTDCRWWFESLLVHSGVSSATRRKATGADHKKIVPWHRFVICSHLLPCLEVFILGWSRSPIGHRWVTHSSLSAACVAYSAPVLFCLPGALSSSSLFVVCVCDLWGLENLGAPRGPFSASLLSPPQRWAYDLNSFLSVWWLSWVSDVRWLCLVGIVHLRGAVGNRPKP